MTGLDRHDRSPELDPLGRLPHEGDRGEGVEVPRNLRDPNGGEASRLGRYGVGNELGPLVAVPPSLRADHHADPHPKGLLSPREPFASPAADRRPWHFYSHSERIQIPWREPTS